MVRKIPNFLHEIGTMEIRWIDFQKCIKSEKLRVESSSFESNILLRKIWKYMLYEMSLK